MTPSGMKIIVEDALGKEHQVRVVPNYADVTNFNSDRNRESIAIDKTYLLEDGSPNGIPLNTLDGKTFKNPLTGQVLTFKRYAP